MSLIRLDLFFFSVNKNTSPMNMFYFYSCILFLVPLRSTAFSLSCVQRVAPAPLMFSLSLRVFFPSEDSVSSNQQTVSFVTFWKSHSDETKSQMSPEVLWYDLWDASF